MRSKDPIYRHTMFNVFLKKAVLICQWKQFLRKQQPPSFIDFLNLGNKHRPVSLLRSKKIQNTGLNLTPYQKEIIDLMKERQLILFNNSAEKPKQKEFTGMGMIGRIEPHVVVIGGHAGKIHALPQILIEKPEDTIAAIKDSLKEFEVPPIPFHARPDLPELPEIKFLAADEATNKKLNHYKPKKKKR